MADFEEELNKFFEELNESLDNNQAFDESAFEEEFTELLLDDFNEVYEDNTIFVTKAIEKKCDIVFCIDLASVSKDFLKEFQNGMNSFF